MNGRHFTVLAKIGAVRSDLLSFFHDRLKVYLRDKGARHDLIDAVLAGGGARDQSPPCGGDVGEADRGGRCPATLSAL